MSKPRNINLPGLVWDSPACDPCNNGNLNVRRCDENARYMIRHPNARFVDGFLVAVFNQGETVFPKVDIIVMSQTEFKNTGLPAIHTLFRIKGINGKTPHSNEGMIVLPEIVENMNGRLQRGYPTSGKLPLIYDREMGGSDCQFTHQWKANQNCRPGRHPHPTPPRADGGWNRHCESCCPAFQYEWSCFGYKLSDTQNYEWAYTPHKRDVKDEHKTPGHVRLTIVNSKGKTKGETCTNTTDTMKFYLSTTIDAKNDWTVYLAMFQENTASSNNFDVDYRYFDENKDRPRMFRYKYDNIHFGRAAWGDWGEKTPQGHKWASEVAIDKVDNGGIFSPLGCETILPDGSIGGLQYTKNSVIISEKLPNQYQITKDRVPIYNGKYRSPYLLCYSNLVYPSLNVGIVGPPSWEQIHKNATDLLTTIRSDKRNNKGWVTELKSMGAMSDKLDKLCVVITGNSIEMWALAYIASNGVGDPEKDDNGKKFVANIGPAISGAPAYRHETFHLEDFITVNIPFEDPLITNEKGISAASAWYCYLPLEGNCEYNNNTVEKLPGDFCTPRAANDKNNENGVCVSIYNDMSPDTRDTLTDLYCNANSQSTDCQCEQRGRFKTFQDLIKTGGAGGHNSDANTACWWRPCKLANSSMFVRQEDLPKHCNATTCINATNVSNSDNISFDNYKQIATCGDQKIVPGGISTPPSTPGGGGTTPPGVSDKIGGGFDSTAMKVLAGVMVALLVIGIGLGLYFFSSGTHEDKVVVKTPLLEKGPITIKVVKPVVKPVVPKPVPKPVVNPVVNPVVEPVATKNVTIPPAGATKQTAGLPNPDQV